jgi:hypothetical protein
LPFLTLALVTAVSISFTLLQISSLLKSEGVSINLVFSFLCLITQMDSYINTKDEFYRSKMRDVSVGNKKKTGAQFY